ncbi:MAG: T9SS type A sorting domain-containing protein [Bacteroidetes bacterium]|nr:T9SS type A sorting domain-containing protein [Bacteroidota bacterium]
MIILTEKTVVNTSIFASGVYLIKLENGKEYEFKKIVKE